jgi:hypothetical protein
MRAEGDIYQRLASSEAELGRLTVEIVTLSKEVQQGANGWYSALERLAADYQRRRAILAQQEVLRWVLLTEQDLC